MGAMEILIGAKPKSDRGDGDEPMGKGEEKESTADAALETAVGKFVDALGIDRSGVDMGAVTKAFKVAASACY
jgi:hypothetical protein